MNTTGVPGHRSSTSSVARVDAEIDQRGFDLRTIDVGRPEVRIDDGLDLDVLAERTTQQAAGRRHEVVEDGLLRLQHLFAREGQELADQVGGALHGFAHLVEPWMDADSHSVVVAQGVDVGHHQHEDVVEVVCHAAGELADRFHLLRLHELLAGAAFAVHRLLAHRDLRPDPTREEDGCDGDEQHESDDQRDDGGEDLAVEPQ